MEKIICKLPEIEISEDAPFKNDQLDRKQLSETLCNIIDIYGQHGCVMSLNGEWGSGKTTFVKMTKQELENKGYKTLYFNAWQADYNEDSLTALIAEMQNLNPDDPRLKKIISISMTLGITAMKWLVKKATGINCQNIEDTIKDIQKVGTKYFKEYRNQKNAIERSSRCLFY